jgi:hypothetical protein
MPLEGIRRAAAAFDAMPRHRFDISAARDISLPAIVAERRPPSICLRSNDAYSTAPEPR